jgi:hypothetical protein
MLRRGLAALQGSQVSWLRHVACDILLPLYRRHQSVTFSHFF